MKNLWRAFKLVLPHRWMLFAYIASSVALGLVTASLLPLVQAYFQKLEGKAPSNKVGIFVDQLLSSIFGAGSQYVVGVCIIGLLILIAKAVFDFLNSYISSWLAQRLRMDAMERMMGKLLTLDQPYFDKQKTGDLVTRMVSDGDNLRKTVKIFLDFLQQPFTVVALASYALYLNPKLFLISSVGVPLVVLPLQKVVRNITKHQKRYQEKTADLSQAMLQNLAGIRIIHSYDAAEKESSNFAKLAESLFRTGLRRNLARAMQRPLTEVLMGLGVLGVVLYDGLQRVGNPGQSTADFVAFIGALGLLAGPVRAMMSTVGEIAEFLPSAERTFEILDVKPTILDAPNAAPAPTLTREIVFEGVSFDYGRGMVLQDLNLTIRAGEKIGIVGRTGVGKSTLLSLLLRFYDPSKGRILIDGVDIKQVTLQSLRSQMALVNQNPFLFHASVADNIRYGRPAASDVEVTHAAQAAMIHDEIMAQPEGYETLCGERGGDLFSGGQRQRIAVARAVLRNAPILLLDEATSALDAFSERRVQEALDKLVVSRTSLIVAHRLSTLRNVDRIIVFAENGGIETIGPHHELLERSPTYRRLWQEQNGAGASAAAGQ